MPFSLIQPVVDVVFGSVGQAGLALALIASALYYRKALGIAGFVQSVAGKLVFSAAVLGVLLLTGVVPGVNVDAAIGLVEEGIAVGQEVLAEVTG